MTARPDISDRCGSSDVAEPSTDAVDAHRQTLPTLTHLADAAVYRPATIRESRLSAPGCYVSGEIARERQHALSMPLHCPLLMERTLITVMDDEVINEIQEVPRYRTAYRYFSGNSCEEPQATFRGKLTYELRHFKLHATEIVVASQIRWRRCTITKYVNDI